MYVPSFLSSKTICQVTDTPPCRADAKRSEITAFNIRELKMSLNSLTQSATRNESDGTHPGDRSHRDTDRNFYADETAHTTSTTEPHK